MFRGVWNGAGTWDAMAAPEHPFDVYVHKTITVEAKTGNPEPTIWRDPETGDCLNRVGLRNPGLPAFLGTVLPILKRAVKTPIVVSCLGYTPAEWVVLARCLRGEPSVAAVEMNLSCPNTEAVADPTRVVKIVRRELGGAKPIIAGSIVSAGASALALCNTLHTDSSGVSGRRLHHIAVEAVGAVVDFGVPVIGLGGIESVETARAFLNVGASAVGVGSANLGGGFVARAVSDGLG